MVSLFYYGGSWLLIENWVGLSSRGDKGRLCKRVILANVPSFWFSFWGNIRMYPRSGFRYRGTSECTLVPVLGAGEHPPKPPFWETALLRTPKLYLRLKFGLVIFYFQFPLWKIGWSFFTWENWLVILYLEFPPVWRLGLVFFSHSSPTISTKEEPQAKITPL